MEDSRIVEIIEELDAEVAGQDVRVRMECWQDGHYVHLFANRPGHLRLAAEFLRTAISPEPASGAPVRPAVTETDLEGIYSKYTRLAFGGLTRQEDWTNEVVTMARRRRAAWRRDRCSLVACGIVSFFIVFAIVLACTVLAALFSNF